MGRDIYMVLVCRFVAWAETVQNLADQTCRACLFRDAFRKGLGDVLRGLAFVVGPKSAMWHWV